MAVTLLLVPFRSGEAVDRHPDLQQWLENGWAVRSAVPRVVESEGTKLMVVLEKQTPEPLTLVGSEPSAPSVAPPRADRRS